MNLEFQAPITGKVLHRQAATLVAIVVVDQHEASRGEAVVKMDQAQVCGFVQVAIETQERQWSDGGVWQRIYEEI